MFTFYTEYIKGTKAGRKYPCGDGGNTMKEIQEYQLPQTILNVCLSQEGAYDNGVEAIISNGFAVGTARQFAQARLLAGADASVSKIGAWTAEGIIYWPKPQRVLFVPATLNPLLKYAKRAVQAQREGREFTISDEHMEHIAIDKRILNMSSEQAIKLVRNMIPTDAIGEDPLTYFLGWDKDYGKMLSNCGIKDVPFGFIDTIYSKKQEQAFCRSIWVGSLNYSSAIFGTHSLRNYGGGKRVFGARVVLKTDRAPTLEEVLAAIRSNWVECDGGLSGSNKSAYKKAGEQ